MSHCVACGQRTNEKTHSDTMYRVVALDLINIWTNYQEDHNKESLIMYIRDLEAMARTATEMELEEHQLKLGI